MIIFIINLVILFVLSICLFNAADTCEKSLRFRTDYYDKDEYYKKKLAVNTYYISALVGMILTLVEIATVLWRL